MISPSVLNVTAPVTYTDVITRVAHQVHLPLASSQYGYSDEIRIPIPEQDAYYTFPGGSYLLIERKLNKDEKGTKTNFVGNGIAFLFEEIRYELNNVLVDKTRHLGYASLMKGLVSFTNTQRHLLTNAGFHQDFSDQVVSVDGAFIVCVPLSIWLGFAEDVKTVIVGLRQDLILTRSRNDNDVLCVTTNEQGSPTASVEIKKIAWVMPYISVSDAARIDLLKTVNKNLQLSLAFRSWELFENPNLATSTHNNWTITTSTQLEKPRFVIVGFQTKRKNNMKMINSHFDHIKLKDIKLFLNSEYYPYCGLDLDFNKHRVAFLFQMLYNFRLSYYGASMRDTFINRDDFLTAFPLIVFDCSFQNERLKNASVDMRLEIETAEAVPENTRCLCLILHDQIVQYSAHSRLVKKL